MLLLSLLLTLTAAQRTFDVVDTFVVIVDTFVVVAAVAGRPSASVPRASTTPLSTFIMAFCQIQNSDSRALAMTRSACVSVCVCAVCVYVLLLWLVAR